MASSFYFTQRWYNRPNLPKILKQLYPGEPMANGVVYLSAEQSVDNLLIKLLGDDESIEIVQSCSSCGYEHIVNKQYLTVCIPEKNQTKRLLENVLCREINDLYNTTQCRKCNGDVDATPKFQKHIFFNLINLNNTKEGQFTDTSLRLNHVPKYLNISELPYCLRGSVTTSKEQQRATSYTSIGHYHAHTYRYPISVWQMYDDTKDKVETPNEKTLVYVQMLMYSR